jgi:hypothetical protein
MKDIDLAGKKVPPPPHATRHPQGGERHALALHLMSCNGGTLHVPPGTHGHIVSNTPTSIRILWDHANDVETSFMVKDGVLLPEGGLVVYE